MARGVGNGERVQMRRPGRLVREVALRVIGEPGDERLRQLAGAHVVERRGIDRVGRVARREQLEEVEPALGGRGREAGEAGVADAGAGRVVVGMAGAGVVHTDPGGGREARLQHRLVLGMEAGVPGGQQPHHLPLGDGDADVLEQRRCPLHRALALMILGEHEAPQLGTEMPRDPRRQRRCHRRALRRQPALAAVSDDPRLDHQVLHHEVRVALEARAGRHIHRQDPHLVHREPDILRPSPALAPPGLCLGRLVHARRFQRRRTLQPLKPAVLLPQRRQFRAQRRVLLQDLQQQAPQPIGFQLVDIFG
jgi:hypothetical protein